MAVDEHSPGTNGAAWTAMVVALPGRLRLRLPDGTNGAAFGLKELEAPFSSWSTIVLRSPSVMAGLGQGGVGGTQWDEAGSLCNPLPSTKVLSHSRSESTTSVTAAISVADIR